MLLSYSPYIEKELQEEIIKLHKEGKNVNQISDILKKETLVIVHTLKFQNINFKINK